jgi:hypothetical protein
MKRFINFKILMTTEGKNIQTSEAAFLPETSSYHKEAWPGKIKLL